jgi:hypothetical protein
MLSCARAQDPRLEEFSPFLSRAVRAALVKRWLPEGMSFDATTPKPAKAKKGKKAA